MINLERCMTPVSEKKLMITRMQSFLQITTPIFTQQFLFFPQLTNFFYGAIIERFFSGYIRSWLVVSRAKRLPFRGTLDTGAHTSTQKFIGVAKTKRWGLAAVWLDLRNVICSVPHGDLDKLLECLPLQGTVRVKGSIGYFDQVSLIKAAPNSGYRVHTFY